MSKRTKLSKILSFIIIYSFIISLTACLPKNYTDEEEAWLEKKGDKVVADWFKENEPTATFSDPMIHHDDGTYGLSDVYYGSYTLNGETNSYVYVSGSDKMYSDRLLEVASETSARRYADGLGLKVTNSRFVNPMMIPINYTAIYDKGNSGQIEELTEDCFSALPYDMEESEVEAYLDGIIDNSDADNSIWINYTCEDAHISKDMINLDFLRSHPYIHQFIIMNKDETESIDLSITRDYQDANKKKIIRIKFRRKASDGTFKELATWDYDL